MTYTSLNFVLFMIVLLGLYYCPLFKDRQWIIVLSGSLFFYLYNGYKYAYFILLTALSIYLASLYIGREKKGKRLVFWLCLIFNFSLLVFLKYYNFVASGIGLKELKLFLPLGISFYTFSATGYLIDVYWGNIKPEKNFFFFLSFISFFPSVIQGPINSYNQLGKELKENHELTYENIRDGLARIIWGLFKKMIIADRAVIALDKYCENTSLYNGTVTLFMVLLYAAQLYTDFSGGIDISIGVSRLLGIKLRENFRRPYFAQSISEYWQRWHISLGDWMKRYLFYPLTTSSLFMKLSSSLRKSKFLQSPSGKNVARVLPGALASFIVFMVVGIWHGANDKYLGFGFWNASVIAVSILLTPTFRKWKKALKINEKSNWWKLFKMFRTFTIVLIGYYFDIAENFKAAMVMLKRTFSDQNFFEAYGVIKELGLTKSDYILIFLMLLVVLFVSIQQEKYNSDNPWDLLKGKKMIVKWVCLFIILFFIAIYGIYGPGYNPRDFVYMQF